MQHDVRYDQVEASVLVIGVFGILLAEMHRNAQRLRPGVRITQHGCAHVDCVDLRVGERLGPGQGAVAGAAAHVEDALRLEIRPDAVHAVAQHSAEEIPFRAPCPGHVHLQPGLVEGAGRDVVGNLVGVVAARLDVNVVHRVVARNLEVRVQRQAAAGIPAGGPKALDHVGQLPLDRVHRCVPHHFLAAAGHRAPQLVIRLNHHLLADFVAVLRRAPGFLFDGRLDLLLVEGEVARHDRAGQMGPESADEVHARGFVVIGVGRQGVNVTKHVNMPPVMISVGHPSRVLPALRLVPASPSGEAPSWHRVSLSLLQRSPEGDAGTSLYLAR